MNTALALFEDHHRAEQALQNLLDQGFNRESLGFAMLDNIKELEVAEATGVAPDDGAPQGSATNAARTSARGAAIGGALALPALIGMALVPGVGALAVAGAFAVAMGVGGGAAVGGAVGALSGSDGGDFVQRLVRFGVPEEEARIYFQGLKGGGVLVYVDDASEERVDQALQILKDAGAVDMQQRLASESRMEQQASKESDSYQH
ncbi:hypothetical protein HNR42_000606 [Deinobacterium chartae]|uniref:Heat induced stress protein YflT n=1 Tax=Deinobacterium chartae TaxID=521158 RepID=A0A841HZ66_9DEIO|nr:hypothetical protein [Deinobacterium chartae]MBB6097192.1 hypothetical protein [Deinobacterium chartae]